MCASLRALQLIFEINQFLCCTKLLSSTRKLELSTEAPIGPVFLDTRLFNIILARGNQRRAQEKKEMEQKAEQEAGQSAEAPNDKSDETEEVKEKTENVGSEMEEKKDMEQKAEQELEQSAEAETQKDKSDETKEEDGGQDKDKTEKGVGPDVKIDSVEKYQKEKTLGKSGFCCCWGE